MPSEEFIVKNVKCGGCVAAIRDGLNNLPGVSAVSVSIDDGTVSVDGTGLDRAALAAKLATLGYPVAR